MFYLKLSFEILFLFAIASSISAKTLQCGFRYDDFAYSNENFYKCFVHNPEIFDDKDVLIDRVEGQHDVAKSNDNVTGIQMSGVNNFPTIVRKNFKNLNVIYVSYSNIKELTSQDLKHFPKLRFLFMQSNKLEYIYHDLFSYNPDMEIINLSYNKISHIDKKAFSYLSKLRILNLDDNVCRLGPAYTREDVLRTLPIIERAFCQSETFSTTESPSLAKIYKLEEKIREQNERIENLKKQLQEREEVIKSQSVIIKDLLQTFQN